MNCDFFVYSDILRLVKVLLLIVMDRRVLQGLDQSNLEIGRRRTYGHSNRGTTGLVVAEREARTLDVFWFLESCTLS